MIPLIGMSWPQLFSLIIVFLILFGLMLEIYSVFTRSNPNLWWGIGIVAGLSILGTGYFWVRSGLITSYLSAFLTGVYDFQGYLFIAGIVFLLIMIAIDIIYSWSRDWTSDVNDGNITTTWNMILTLGSVTLLVFLLVFPGYLSERLEKVETSQSGVISFDELTSTSSIESIYTPYWELNQTTGISEDDGSGPYETGAYFLDPYDPWPIYASNSVWDTVGYWDIHISTENLSQTDPNYPVLILMGDISPTAMVEDNMNQFSLGIDTNVNYLISDMGFTGYLSNYYPDAYSPCGELFGDTYWPSEWRNNHNGYNWFNFSIPIEYLNANAAVESSYFEYGFKISIEFPNGITYGDMIQTNFKINPEYLQEDSTIWTNDTVTHYESYIQTYSNPYAIGLWTFGIGGILLMILSPCILPWIRIIPWLKRGFGL